MQRWAIRLGAVAAAAVLPWLSGLGGLIVPAVLLALPAAVECIRPTSERYAGLAAIVALGASCAFALPGMIGIVMAVWCALGAVMLFVGGGSAIRRGMTWAALTALLGCGVVAWLQHTSGGDMFEALAQSAVDWVSAQKDPNRVLVQAYQAGYASMGDDVQTIPMLQLFGSVLLTPEMQRELLFSLRTTLRLMLQQTLPGLMVLWMLVTGVTAAWLPDVIRRKRGRIPELPAFGDWRLSRESSQGMLLLLLGYLVQLMSGTPVWQYWGAMCTAAYQYIYMLAGLCAMEGVAKMFGLGKVPRRVIMIALALTAPFVVFLFGLLDQMMDFRHPRGLTDDDEDDEGGFMQ